MTGETFRFDPRDFIAPPYIRCPHCGANTFGVLAIYGRGYRRRCRQCMESEGYDLPAADKKVLYIDQFAISNMMVALHREHRERMRDAEAEYWTTLFDLLDRLVKLQVLVCPPSSAHWEESVVSRAYGELRSLYDHLAGECSFRDTSTIKRFQLHDAFGGWLAGEEPRRAGHEAALEGRRDEWLDRLRIDTRIDVDDQTLDELRETRARTHTAMANVARVWRDEGVRPFLERFEQEWRGYGPSVMRRYGERLGSFGEVLAGRREFTPDDLYPSESQLIITDFKDILVDAGRKQAEHWGTIERFFNDAALARVPFLRLSCGLLAALATEISQGRGRDPDRGMVHDVNFVSTLLPHCDAMLIDDRAKRLLDLADAHLHFGYDVAVFSTRTRGDLLEWLLELERGIPAHHHDLIAEVYGEDWLKPFREIYTWRNEH